MNELDSRDVIASVCPRAEFIPAANPHTLASIQCGIFFVMAFWSGPSRTAFVALARVLARLDPQQNLRLVVGDTDEIRELHTRPPFCDILAGYGETVWIKDGQIVAHSGRGLNVGCFEPNTRKLMEMCQSAEPQSMARPSA